MPDNLFKNYVRTINSSPISQLIDPETIPQERANAIGHEVGLILKSHREKCRWF